MLGSSVLAILTGSQKVFTPKKAACKRPGLKGGVQNVLLSALFNNPPSSLN